MPSTGCCSVPEAEPYAAAINGRDGKSWHLPLPPINTTLEPYAPGEAPEVDRLLAAAKLVGNHTAVARFALRGPGKKGPRPVSAPLSDPTAQPAMEHLDTVDAAMRHVAHALLVGIESKQVGSHALGPGPSSGPPVVSSLAYLRDRVGVPRDLPLPAARQLRAHINWLIDGLESL